MDFYNIYNQIDNVTVVTDAAKNLPKSKVSKSTINKIKEPVPRYFESINQINGFWSEGEYDLIEIFKLLKFESYFFKATEKKHSLVTKSGFGIHSDNDTIKEYLDGRFSLMELQTGISLNALLNKVIFYLIVCSNSYIIKTRDKDFKYAKSYFVDEKEMHPITGYFLVHPTSLKPRYKWVRFRDGVQVKNKLILDKWVFVNKRGIIVEFDPDDVIHFHLHMEDGMTLGTPEVVSVIDDIRTLRKIEEDVQLLLYRDLFPLIHYQIEEPGMIDHVSGITEIDQAKYDLEKMVQDGGIATDARHKIQYIGSQGKHLEVRPYLEYFQHRVFSGLGVSATDMGLGADISGNTAQTMSNQILDASRFIQQEVTRQFDETVLMELMLQSPFGVEALKKGDRPTLKFEEIDIEWKIRTENHAADQFTKGVISIDEARNDRGLKTLSDEDLKRTHPYMYGTFSEPAVEAQKQIKSAADKDTVKSAKTNSNVTKSTRKKVKDSESWLLTSNLATQLIDVVSYVKESSPLNIKFNIKLETQFIYDQIKKNAISKLQDGIESALSDIGKNIKIVSSDLDEIIKSLNKDIDLLAEEVATELIEDLNKNTSKAIKRIDSANKTEQVKAYNLGYSLVAIEDNVTVFDTYHYDTLEEKESISIETINDLLPKHPNTKSLIKIKKSQDMLIADKHVNTKKRDAFISTLPGVQLSKEYLEKTYGYETGDLVFNLMKDEQTDSVEPIIDAYESKMQDALMYLQDLKSIVETVVKNTETNNSATSSQLSIVHETMNNQLKMFIGAISDMKEENNEIATKYVSSLDKMLRSIDGVSKDNIEAMKTIADSIPREITVNSAPVEVKIDNPPIDVQLTVQDTQVQKQKINKQVSIKRDELGNIVSAEIMED